MAEDDEIHAFKIINEAVTAAAVSNKNSFNYQFKSNNDFITIFSNSLQKHSHVFQM